MPYKDKDKEKAWHQAHKKQKAVYDKWYKQRHKNKINKRINLWVKEDKQKHKQKYYWVSREQELKQYGLSLAQYATLAKRQHGLCEICKQRNVRNRKLCVDHNHQTDKFRGLLCHRCNCGLGMFRDSSKLVKRALNYLKERP